MLSAGEQCFRRSKWCHQRDKQAELDLGIESKLQLEFGLFKLNDGLKANWLISNPLLVNGVFTVYPFLAARDNFNLLMHWYLMCNCCTSCMEDNCFG